MRTQIFISFLLSVAALPGADAQTIEKIYFDAADSAGGYYLAVPPRSGEIKGTLILMNSFSSPENILPETRLHNVAYANDLLTIYFSMGFKLYADTAAIARLNAVVKDLQTRFHIDRSRVVLAGYNMAGNIALRYTELANAAPASYLLHPRAVFAADTPVDIPGLWQWCERQIKKNFYPGTVGDARAFMDILRKEQGAQAEKPETYRALTAFDKNMPEPGNERYLEKTAVRLYYDTDIQWQLANRRNSLYDTGIPEATEMIDRLLLMGNTRAEFIPARQPGVRSNGQRHPGALSMVDEVDCIHWVKNILDIFDPLTWHAPYTLPAPAGWSTERFALPPDFAARTFSFHGVEEIRFHPGWADAGSEGYWTYTYLWWIDARQAIDAEVLEGNLRAYYNGLVESNIAPRHIPAEKIFPVSASMKKNATMTGDTETFSGTVKMLDYMGQRPMILHCVVHVKETSDTGRTAVLVEMSPQPLQHGVWKKMDGMVDGVVL